MRTPVRGRSTAICSHHLLPQAGLLATKTATRRRCANSRAAVLAASAAAQDPSSRFPPADGRKPSGSGRGHLPPLGRGRRRGWRRQPPLPPKSTDSAAAAAASPDLTRRHARNRAREPLRRAAPDQITGRIARPVDGAGSVWSTGPASPAPHAAPSLRSTVRGESRRTRMPTARTLGRADTAVWPAAALLHAGGAP